MLESFGKFLFLLEALRKELPEKAKFSKYAGLEEYLPPNNPFQTDEQAGTN